MYPILELLQLAATIFMTGLIWFVQIVHYPLFANVSENEFRAYEERHQFLTSIVVIPAMFLEAGTAAILFVQSEPTLSTSLALILLIVIWLSTFLIQVPLHAKLEKGYDIEIIQRLVSTNWIRTIAWSGRAVILLMALK